MNSPNLGPHSWNLPRESGVPGLPQLYATRRPYPARKLLLAKANTSHRPPPIHTPCVGPIKSLPTEKAGFPSPTLSYPAGLSLKDSKPILTKEAKESLHAHT